MNITFVWFCIYVTRFCLKYLPAPSEKWWRSCYLLGLLTYFFHNIWTIVWVSNEKIEILSHLVMNKLFKRKEWVLSNLEAKIFSTSQDRGKSPPNCLGLNWVTQSKNFKQFHIRPSLQIRSKLATANSLRVELENDFPPSEEIAVIRMKKGS